MPQSLFFRQACVALILAASAMWVGAQPATPSATSPAPATAPDSATTTQAQRQVEQPGNNAPTWREVRKEGQTHYSSLPARESGVLIQSAGETWRQLRNGPITFYGGWFIVLVAAAIGAFYLWRGTMQLQIQGNPNAKFDPQKFTWLGSLSSYADDGYLLLVNDDHPAKSAADLAMLLNVMVGFDARDSTSLDRPREDYLAGIDRPLDGLRIGLPSEYFGEGVEPDVGWYHGTGADGRGDGRVARHDQALPPDAKVEWSGLRSSTALAMELPDRAGCIPVHDKWGEVVSVQALAPTIVEDRD